MEELKTRLEFAYHQNIVGVLYVYYHWVSRQNNPSLAEPN